jgi:tRNA(Ile)-lysidine synthase
MPALFERLKPLLLDCPGVARFMVGYSGGVDSHVLLQLLATHRQWLGNRAIEAVYVDHGLQPEAAAWGRHCEAVCRALEVPFRVVSVAVEAVAGESREAAARSARYAALGALLENRDALLTGHHRDDQAETLLLQLLRGGGPRGLAAMPSRTRLGRGLLMRPLLDLERTEILRYASGEGLVWIEDRSNADCRFDRNYLRHEILPRLKQRWPGVTRTLARSARWCGEAAALAEVQGDSDLGAVRGCHPGSIDLTALEALDPRRRRNVVRRWLHHLGLPAPSAAQLRRVLEDAVGASRDRQPCVDWPGAQVRRYRDQLFAMAPLVPHDAGRVWSVRFGVALGIPGVGRLAWRPTQGQGVRRQALAEAPVTVRFRRGGERFHPAGRSHGQVLKKLLQQAAVPPWERDRVPLIFIGDRLAMVPGLGVAREFQAREAEEGVVFEWQKTSLSGTL